ncbi:GNAT family N-acetyltransferase [Paenibacillus radicis (ex Xue et al. 2023)]|uniref:GNAT family N-acetyltransferase n=1 Tax=Paenibacillus radicis (ex Xue et al. 2023) TaxID=2972489 RepID=A0ABT1YDA1_9BACL|nr:GNAT family N-acetyltransferase [Paenibacillus radicis (ex Xue et al. 2023)]MCR8631162.1 GNAT family N-acetyltransferase [Paenibacillus radicis (ex Xue et al. 2023)]
MEIRSAQHKDIESILDIYNEAILNTVATFDTELRTLEQQTQWFHNHGELYPIWVAEQEGIIIGWASLNPYSDRLAYRRTAELSLYIHSDYRGQGVGKQLMKQVLDAGLAAGLHTVLSRIVEGNESSIHLHEVYDFKHVGIMREVGFKFGRMLDVIMMQKML